MASFNDDEEDQSRSNVSANIQEVNWLCKVVANHTAENPSEASLREGDLVIVTHVTDIQLKSGWSYVRHKATDQKGWIPSCCIVGKTTSSRYSIQSDIEKCVEATVTDMIKVTNLPKDVNNKELQSFFENRRKSGGGKISLLDLDYTLSSTIIKFEDEKAVQRVLDKRPLKFKKKLLNIEAFYEDDGDDNADDDQEFSSSDDGNGLSDNTTENEDDTDEKDDAPICTIQIHGFDTNVTEDALELHFGSKRRSGGGDIANIEINREEGFARITYENEEVAERVVSKQQVLEERKLEVKLHTPPTRNNMYKNKVFFSGINPNTSVDSLNNFLELKSRAKPIDIIDGEEEGTSLVTFDKPIDHARLQKSCNEQALEKYNLTVSSVPISHCIIVTEISPKTTEDTLQYYFENKKRSGGGDVTKIELIEEGTYLVHFKDYDCLDDVCKKKHTLDKQEVSVQCFHKCLFQGPKFEIPEPVDVSDLSSTKLTFVSRSTSQRETIQQLLLCNNAKAIWSDSQTCILNIECIVNRRDKNRKRIVQFWPQSPKKALQEYLDTIRIETVDLLQEVWENVIMELEPLLNLSSDNVAIIKDNANKRVSVVGVTDDFDGIWLQVQKTIDVCYKELERMKQQTKEHIKVERHKLSLLKEIKFDDVLRKNDLDVTICYNTEQNELILTGLSSDVSKAKVEMYEKVFLRINQYSLGQFTAAYLDFMQEATIKMKLHELLKDKSLPAVWDTDLQNNITVYSFSESDVADAAIIIKDAIIETTSRKVSDLSKSLLNSNQLHQKIKELEARFPGLTKIKPSVRDSQIHILCVKEIAGAVLETINDFLRENVLIQEALPMTMGKIRFIELYFNDDMNNIMRDLHDHFVKVNTDEEKSLLKIIGTKDGLEMAKRKVEGFIQSIEVKKHVLKKPGILEHIQTPQGIEKLSNVEKARKCTIDARSEDDIDDKKTEIVHKNETTQPQKLAGCILPGQREILVLFGDITELEVDVIVNPSDELLQHEGGLARTIVHKGGKSIQEECEDYVKSNGKLLDGDVFISSSGSLKCKNVCHAVGPIWQGGRHSETEILRETIFKTMEACGIKNSSIATPAICTGIFKFPVKEATSVIVEALKDFFEENENSTITKIYLCDIDETNVNEFVSSMINLFGKEKITEYQRTTSDGAWRTLGSSGKDRRSDIPSPPSFSIGNLDVKLVVGELVEEKVDMLVNIVSHKFQQCDRALSKNVIVAGGRGLLEECHDKYPDGIQYGEFAETSGGNLQIKTILHGCLPPWDSTGSSIRILKTLLSDCLNKAEVSGMRSIAIPPLGTEGHCYPRETVAREVFQSIAELAFREQWSIVKEIHIVISNKDITTIQAMEAEQQKLVGAVDHDKSVSRSNRIFGSDFQSSHKKGSSLHKYLSQGVLGPSSEKYCLQLGEISMKIYKGEHAMAKTESIINITTKDLDFNGPITRPILVRGGEKLKELMTKQRIKLSKKDYASTEGIGLPCSTIIHASLLDSHSDVKTTIVKVLMKADKHKCTSVAFPDPNLWSDDQDILNTLYIAITEIQEKGPKALKEVHIVVNNRQSIQKFGDTIQQLQNKATGARSKSLINRFSNLVGWGKTTNLDARHTESRPTSLVTDVSSDSVILYIYAESKKVIDYAISEIEDEFNKDFKRKIFEDNIIKRFNESRITEVNKLTEYGVDVKIETRIGRIRLYGLAENMAFAVRVVEQLIHEAGMIKYEEEEAKRLSNMLKWCFIDPEGKMISYPDHVSLTLEKAFLNKRNSIKITGQDGTDFIVDFDKMVEYAVHNRDDEVIIIRKELFSSGSPYGQLPTDWQPMAETDNLLVLSLTPSGSEFKEVVEKLKRFIEFDSIRVDRIQNRTLFHQYRAKKHQMDSENPSDTLNERELWHGTPRQATESINAHGLNRSYCGKNATAFGNGVYLAVDPSYSAQDQYSPKDSSGRKHVYLCKALTGQFTNGSPDMRVPPPKSESAKHILYDSVVDDLNRPKIFVIFNDTQVYPEYLITFK